MSDSNSLSRQTNGTEKTPSAPSPEKNITLDVDGMSCASCVRRVERGLTKISSIQNAAANFANGKVRVDFSGKLDMSSVEQTLEKLGYPLKEQGIDLQVDGMTCASCVSRVEKALKKEPGVVDSQVNLINGSAHVVLATSQDVIPSLITRLDKLGYPARVKGNEAEEETHKEGSNTRREVTKLAVAIVLTLPVVLLGMGMDFSSAFTEWLSSNIGMTPVGWLEALLATLVILIPGRKIFSTGFRALSHLAPEMNSLVALGSGTAWVFSMVVLLWPSVIPSVSRHLYFEPSAVIVTLILIGRFLEARAKRQSNDAIQSLMGMQVKSAHVYEDGLIREVKVDQLRVGDIVVAKPGERIAVDGEVVEGRAHLDESMLTGEATPVSRTVGDAVMEATVNMDGSLKYKVTRVGSDTTLSHIIRVVEQAQSSKLPIQSLVDKISAVFVPVIIVIALVTFIIWMLCGASLAQSISVAVSVLIIACPCAMGLATPVSLMVSSGRAARMGILISQGDSLQRLHTISTIAFDKTGTLTEGKPRLSSLSSLSQHFSDDEILVFAASLESHSEHVIAKAVTNAAEEKGFSLKDADDVSIEPGAGLTGSIYGKKVGIGNDRLMNKLGFEEKEIQQALDSASSSAGEGAFIVAIDDHLSGVITISDPVRHDAKAVIHWLKSHNINVVMLTGDRQKTASVVAQELGIDQVYASLLPDDKADTLKRIQAETKGGLAFVGDGINDAPALAQADVGIAMGQGTDIAIESGDMVLTSNSLISVADAISLSRATIRNVKQNLGWAFVYNLCLIPLAAGILYPFFGILLAPALAALAMACSSLIVISNALRLKRFSSLQKQWVG